MTNWRNKEWMQRARCANGDGPDFFDRSPDVVVEAKAFCVRCPVWMHCLNYAIRVIDADCGEKVALDRGVWGGMDGSERVRIRRARANAVREET